MAKSGEELETGSNESLSAVIREIRTDQRAANETAVLKILDQIDKYGETDKTKAYLLGILFKCIAGPDFLSPDNKLLLNRTIKEKKLSMFYYHKSEPNFEIFVLVSWVFVVIGCIIFIFGILKLISGYFTFGILRNYLLPTFDNGTYGTILGSIMFFGGIIRLRYETKRTRFIRSLVTLLKSPRCS